MLRILIALFALLALPSAAFASPALDVGIADDRVLIHGTHAEASAAVSEWRALGVDIVRVHARWVAHVPEPNSPARPAGFNQADPNDPRYNWDTLDRAVGLVRGSGMRVLLTITGSGPVWGSLEPGVGSQRWKPSPESFAEFARAVALRYGPHVDQYVLWNEPNHELWLQPQNSCTSRGCTPYAPHLYRKIVRAADPAVRAADPDARVMMGALAPRGTSARSKNARLRPLAFLRAMGCVSSSYKRVRTGSCRGFLPASAYGFAYHPHGLKLSPSARSSHPDEAQMGDLGRLVSALDRVTRAGGLSSRHPSGRFPLWLDEYGYQTNPPDRVLGVSSAVQSTWLQQGAYMAWAHPRVRGLAQYAWRDEPLGASGAGWQSGLRYEDGRPKAALTSFKQPFWVVRTSSSVVRLWGQVRPGSGASTVTVQRRSSSGAWRALTRVGTDPRGFFRRDWRTRSRGSYRFVWSGGTSSVRTVS